MAPVYGRPERPLAWQGVTAASRQQAERGFQAGADMLYREHPDPGDGELYVGDSSSGGLKTTFTVTR